MFSFLIGKLSPYGTVLKLIAIALVLAAVFSSGYKVSDWRWTAKYETEEAARAAAIIKSQEAARAADEKNAAIARDAEAAHAEKLAQLNQEIASLRRKIEGERDEDFQTTSIQYPFTLQFVREFNSLSNGAGNPADVPGTAANPAGSTDEAAATADLTRKEVLLTHAEQMNQCLAWKQQLEDIIEWDRRTYGR